MSAIEDRVHRLERLVIGLAVASLASVAWNIAGPAPNAVAQPKPVNAEFNTVRAAEILAKDVDANRLVLSSSLIFQDATKNNSVSLTFGPKDGAPGIVLKSPGSQLALSPEGIIIESPESKASIAITRSRVVITDKDGKLRQWPD